MSQVNHYSNMKFPHMLIMRNSPNGSIWQAYRVENEIEVQILTKNARHNGFIVQKELEDYTTETSPRWRETEEWKAYLRKISDEIPRP